MEDMEDLEYELESDPFMDSSVHGRGQERGLSSSQSFTGRHHQQQQREQELLQHERQHQQQMSYQSRKDKANAAVLRSMPLAERGMSKRALAPSLFFFFFFFTMDGPKDSSAHAFCPRPWQLARPASLDDYIGQQELIGPGGILRALVLQDTVP